MTAHIIFDNELKIIKEASDVLFCPQEGQSMDDRTAYQRIHYTLEDCKTRFLKSEGGSYD